MTRMVKDYEEIEPRPAPEQPLDDLPRVVAEIAGAVAGLSEAELVADADAAAAAIATGADVLWNCQVATGAPPLVDAVARGLAILARRPAGVTFAGRHWCTRPHRGCPGDGHLELASDAGVGVHYTPLWLAGRVVMDALDARVATPGPLVTTDREQWVARPMADVSALRVADIACGSGAFLVAAAQYLSAMYVGALPWLDATLVGRAGRLLALQHVYGVDVQPAAVALARLSLALMAPLDDVDEVLAAHVIVGDALTGPGFEDLGIPAAVPGVNFAAAFPEVAAAGGFDAVVGNPPWMGRNRFVNRLGTAYRDHIIKHLGGGYRGYADLAAFFVPRSVELVRDGLGQVALLLPGNIGRAAHTPVAFDAAADRGGHPWQVLEPMAWPAANANFLVGGVWLARGAPAPDRQVLLLTSREDA